MDEDRSLLDAANRGELGGHRVGSHSAKSPSSNLTRAIVETVKFLGDGQWKKADRVRIIAQLYSTTYGRIASEIGIAESLSGRWVALVNEATPGEAPDER